MRRNSISNNSKMIKSSTKSSTKSSIMCSTKSSIMCNSRSKLEILVYNRKYYILYNI